MYSQHIRRATPALFATLAFLASEPASARQAAHPLTDAEIAHVAVTANTIDIDAGKVAGSRAKGEDVRKFAATMVSDHSAVNQQAAALAKRLGVTPADNDISRSLLAAAATAREKLEGIDGVAFDRAYVRREVEYHAAVLRALDETLIPATRNDELKALLRQARDAIAAHLDHAKALQASLGARR